MYDDLVMRLRDESTDIFENCRNCTCGANSDEAADAIEMLEKVMVYGKDGEVENEQPR